MLQLADLNLERGSCDSVLEDVVWLGVRGARLGWPPTIPEYQQHFGFVELFREQPVGAFRLLPVQLADGIQEVVDGAPVVIQVVVLAPRANDEPEYLGKGSDNVRSRIHFNIAVADKLLQLFFFVLPQLELEGLHPKHLHQAFV